MHEQQPQNSWGAGVLLVFWYTCVVVLAVFLSLVIINYFVIRVENRSFSAQPRIFFPIRGWAEKRPVFNPNDEHN